MAKLPKAVHPNVRKTMEKTHALLKEKECIFPKAKRAVVRAVYKMHLFFLERMSARWTPEAGKR